MTIHLNLTLTDMIGVALLALFVAFGFIALLPLVAEKWFKHKTKLTVFIMSVVAIAATVLLVGCEPPPRQQMDIIDNTYSHVSVQRLAVFEDDLAYNNRRGIYIITDHKTKKSYLGISGIGISEVGSHLVSNGKVTTIVKDER